MYCIAVYDVDTKRVNKVKKIFREYMHWIQNSVFEGQLTKSEKKELTSRVKNIINESNDSIIFFELRSQKYLEKEIIGKEKSPTDNIL